MQARTLVLGDGNTLLMDEGAGVHVVNFLQSQCPGRDDLDLVDAGTLSFTLAGLLDGRERLVVVDAAELGGPAGAVRVFEGEAMDRFIVRHRKLSVHEVSLLDLLSMARLGGGLPAQRALIGIQPGRLDWGEQPSEAVAGAIPAAGSIALALIDRWRGRAVQSTES